ncbi:MAG: hypothetical protein LCH99_15530 [Proteobacteria bacterium]|nr:hypothetical protein [Pseudomonadota bacterium]
MTLSEKDEAAITAACAQVIVDEAVREAMRHALTVVRPAFEPVLIYQEIKGEVVFSDTADVWDKPAHECFWLKPEHKRRRK